MATKFREIARGLRFPEGPIAMPDGSVLLVEIERQTLTRVQPNGKCEVIAKTGGGPNGAAIGPDGKCYIANNGGFAWIDDENGLRAGPIAPDYSGGRIERVDLGSGKVEVLYSQCGAHLLRGPNDLVFDRQGGMWFTDLGKRRTRDLDYGGVYYAKADGSLIREVVYPMLTPNGIGLTADEKTLYVAETVPGRVWQFDIVAPGEIKKQPYPSPNGGRLLAGVPGYQTFDSLALDAAGNVCVATLWNGGINVIPPDGGPVEHIPLPDYYCTNICFGGADLKTAYITLSTSGRLVAMDWPRPGLPLNFLNTR